MGPSPKKAAWSGAGTREELHVPKAVELGALRSTDDTTESPSADAEPCVLLGLLSFSTVFLVSSFFGKGTIIPLCLGTM